MALPTGSRGEEIGGVLVFEAARYSIGSTFPSDVGAGWRHYLTGSTSDEVFYWDATRAAWLSAGQIVLDAQANVAATGYLDLVLGVIPGSATVGFRHDFPLIATGMMVAVGAASTCSVALVDDGADVLTLSLSAETNKRDMAMESAVIAAGSAIALRVASGTALVGCRAWAFLRRTSA